MKKKLRKLAEDIFNLSYVPIWGLEDKELRIQQYEQILKEVYDDAQQSMLIISGDPIFRGVKLGQMTDRQWQEMQEYFTGRKQQPQFDPEKVKESIETLRDFSFLFGQFHSRPSHWKYEYYENEMRKAVIHLLHELDTWALHE